jgi:hypothetical protein
MKLAIAIFALTFTAAAHAAENEPRRAALRARAVLKVIHPDTARKNLLELAKKIGGFPQLVTDQQLVLKVPPEKLSSFLEEAAKEGLLLDREINREDLTHKLSQLEASLRSKTDTYTKLQSFLGETNVQATLQIEQQLINLVAELEQVKGQLRFESERAQWAVADLSFQFRARERLSNVSSPFGWLNTVDLERFLAEFDR